VSLAYFPQFPPQLDCGGWNGSATAVPTVEFQTSEVWASLNNSLTLFTNEHILRLDY
jgi:hypothetical protein